ncbi:hypothetical protein EJB05_03426, partial [Eragrostis curvula]
MAFWEDWCKDCDWPWTKIFIGLAVVAVLGGLIAVLVVIFAFVKPPTATVDDAVLHRAVECHKAGKKVTFNVKVGGVNKAIKLTDMGVTEFDKEKKAGKFQMELRLDTVLTYKGRGTKCPLGVVCPLQLQLVDPDLAATAFQVTKCTVLRAKKSGC